MERFHTIKKTEGIVHSSSFHEPGRISTSQGKQYCTNKDNMRQNGTVHQSRSYDYKTYKISILVAICVSFTCTTQNVQPTVNSVQCTSDNVQRAVYNVQR